MIKTDRLTLRHFREFVTFVSDADGNPIYENTIQWAILKWEWEEKWG